MTAPTTTVRFVIAQAAARGTGLAHVCSQRDTGALNPVCGANPIRSKIVNVWATAAEHDGVLCPDCQQVAPNIGGLAITHISVTSVTVSENARTADDGLMASIRHSGVTNPIVVRPAGSNTFLLVAGSRRLHAATTAGHATIPAITIDPTRQSPTLTSLLDNLHRQDLNPIQQAHAYQHACNELGLSKAELGRRIGVSREQISNTIRLLQLPAEDQERIAAGDLTAQAGRAILANGTKDLNAAKPATPQLHDLAHRIAALLDVRVRVTGRKISLEIDDADLYRLLNALTQEAA